MLSLVTVLEGREAGEGTEKRKGTGQEEVGGRGSGGKRRIERERGGEEGQLKGHVGLQGRCVSKVM